VSRVKSTADERRTWFSAVAGFGATLQLSAVDKLCHDASIAAELEQEAPVSLVTEIYDALDGKGGGR
jgi:hypothetical protein